MKNSDAKGNTQFILFYFLIVYVFAFLFWWSYLLYKKTEQQYLDTIQYKALHHEFKGSNEISYQKTDEFKETYSKFRRQKIMVIAEGSVFFLILLAGMIKIRNSFVKEVEIARQQRNFILSITHELKSPLSSIKLMNETIKMRELPKEKQNQLIDNSLDEVERLENLVENILLAAKIENNRYGFSMEEQNFSAIVKDICSKFELSKKRNVKATIQDNVVLTGDKSALTSIVVNLLENAYKYAPEWPYIEVLLQKKNDKVIFSVADFGNGIPENEKNKIFEKFYRIGNEDTRKAKGTGLGLYIVKQLVEFHCGTIEIKDNVPSGAVFYMEFLV